jgi:hypothetical protein
MRIYAFDLLPWPYLNAPSIWGYFSLAVCRTTWQ